MTELKKNDRHALNSLFVNSQDTLIDSCLQGYCGRAFSEGESAAVAGGDFIYLGGKPDGELLKEVLRECPTAKILVPMSGEWNGCIEHICGANAQKTVRYATRKGTAFDIQRLKELAAPPEGFKIERVNARIFTDFAREPWSRDFTVNFPSFGDYARLGAGYAATIDRRAVAGASSYSVCDGAIEVQIITEPSYRRKGLARACAAKLILDCTERGVYPNWDAEHQASLHIAQSLGYKFLREYSAFNLKRQ